MKYCFVRISIFPIIIIYLNKSLFNMKKNKLFTGKFCLPNFYFKYECLKYVYNIKHPWALKISYELYFLQA